MKLCINKKHWNLLKDIEERFEYPHEISKSKIIETIINKNLRLSIFNLFSNIAFIIKKDLVKKNGYVEFDVKFSKKTNNEINIIYNIIKKDMSFISKNDIGSALLFLTFNKYNTVKKTIDLMNRLLVKRQEIKYMRFLNKMNKGNGV